MSNTPAFQYYPADFLSDPEVMFWDAEAVGCYWLMISYLWINGGKAELNYELIASLFRVNRKLKAEKLWKKIEKKFVLEDGYITHKRIFKEMQKQQQSRLRRQEAGKKGAKSRWGNDGNANGNASTKPMAKNSPSSSSSTSTSVNTTTTTMLEQIFKLWNSFAKKKSSNAETATVMQITRTLTTASIGVSFEMFMQALENYKAACQHPHSQAQHCNLYKFALSRYEKFLPGAFDIDNYDKSKFGSKNNGKSNKNKRPNLSEQFDSKELISTT